MQMWRVTRDHVKRRNPNAFNTKSVLSGCDGMQNYSHNASESKNTDCVVQFERCVWPLSDSSVAMCINCTYSVFAYVVFLRQAKQECPRLHSRSASSVKTVKNRTAVQQSKLTWLRKVCCNDSSVWYQFTVSKSACIIRISQEYLQLRN